MKPSKINTLITISMICSGISIFYGGSLLSAFALGIAVGMYYKAKKGFSSPVDELVIQALQKRIRSAIILAAIMFVVNVISAYYLYPMIADQYQSILNSGSMSGSHGSSIWG